MFQIDAELNKLRDKQRKFVYEYIACMKPGKAAVRAGYSAKTASVTGSKLLALGNIRRIVDHLLAERAKECEIDAARIFKEFWDIAQATFVKMADRLRALESCAKYTGGFAEKHDHKVTGDLNITRTTYNVSSLPAPVDIPSVSAMLRKADEAVAALPEPTTDEGVTH